MASTTKYSLQPGGADDETPTDMEEEEELFEINLEAVNNIPPPHNCESCVTATGNALLANCLLPIADVSTAIPMGSKISDVLSAIKIMDFYSS
ncbi:hypothetical protein Nepgr_011773 [Nepenthes gracilis]|uniref:Uncharacterized protein n=1 Tax=Nepenthes gracilis TaxID=150966 RepID=A0AAD3SG38_NEPGR|nr:hypothetical protein Nepgr_011773 [Nepenthes gracilis]